VQEKNPVVMTGFFLSIIWIFLSLLHVSLFLTQSPHVGVCVVVVYIANNRNVRDVYESHGVDAHNVVQLHVDTHKLPALHELLLAVAAVAAAAAPPVVAVSAAAADAHDHDNPQQTSNKPKLRWFSA
jgi:hypothetical protein